MKKGLFLITGIVMYSSIAGAATYDYSVEMKESDGSVHKMGDVQVNINQEGEESQSSASHNNDLLNKIQNQIRNNYREYNVNINIRDGVVTL